MGPWGAPLGVGGSATENEGTRITVSLTLSSSGLLSTVRLLECFIVAAGSPLKIENIFVEGEILGKLKRWCN